VVAFTTSFSPVLMNNVNDERFSRALLSAPLSLNCELLQIIAMLIHAYNGIMIFEKAIC